MQPADDLTIPCPPIMFSASMQRRAQRATLLHRLRVSVRRFIDQVEV